MVVATSSKICGLNMKQLVGSDYCMSFVYLRYPEYIITEAMQDIWYYTGKCVFFSSEKPFAILMDHADSISIIKF